MMGRYGLQDYLYTLDPSDLRAAPGLGDIANWRTRRTVAGGIVEIEAWPIWRTGSDSQRCARGRGPTREAQRRINERNAARKLDRLLNANFGRESLHLVCTYAGEAPSPDVAQRLNRNYIARLRREFKREQKAGLIPEGEEYKWLYVIEYAGPEGEPKRIHHHIVCNCRDRDACEALWVLGRCNADRLKPDESGLIALAKYLTKAPAGKRRTAHSRNLKPPRVYQGDKVLSRRRAALVLEDAAAHAREVFGAICPGCELVSCEVRRSEWVQGAYMYARLRRREEDGHGPAQTRRGGGQTANSVYRPNTRQRDHDD